MNYLQSLRETIADENSFGRNHKYMKEKHSLVLLFQKNATHDRINFDQLILQDFLRILKDRKVEI